MKLSNKKNQINYIRPINVQELRSMAQKTLADTPYWNLLLALADGLDTAIAGDNTYFIVGTTKDVTALSITGVQGATREAVYADSLAELGEKSSIFYDPLD